MAVRKILVAGAQETGQGIAEAAATSGIEVIFSGEAKRSLDEGLAGIESSLNRAIDRWAITASEKRAILSRICPVEGMVDIEGVEFGIEAAPEDLDAKKRVFAALDEGLGPEVILATTTATLSITEIGSATTRQDKIVGMHFLVPVPRAAIVEVVRALGTSDETFEAAKALVSQMNKQIVEVHEYPGFITTRIMIPFVNEAAYALMEGVATARDIDAAIKLGFGFPMGPLELADTMGLDEVMLLMESLFKQLGDSKYRPCPLLRRLVREGRLGKKTGSGFFTYEAERESLK